LRSVDNPDFKEEEEDEIEEGEGVKNNSTTQIYKKFLRKGN
jgi:hypothetical protein